MLTRMQYDILLASARSLQELLKEMQVEPELFASPNTLQRVEVYLLVPATLELLAKLRRAEPVWFEIGY